MTKPAMFRVPAARNAGLAIAGGLLLAGSASPMFAKADEYTPIEDTLITYLVPPSYIDDCGVESDGWFIPEGVPNVYYEQDELIWGDERVDGIGKVVIFAFPVEGYTFPDGLETAWTFYFTDDTCPGEVPVDEPTDTPTDTPTEPPAEEPTEEPVEETPAPTETPGALIPPSYIDAPPAENAAHLATTGGEFNWAALFLGALAVLFGSALSYREWKKVTR